VTKETKAFLALLAKKVTKAQPVPLVIKDKRVFVVQWGIKEIRD
jgi:hypothetical protein